MDVAGNFKAISYQRRLGGNGLYLYVINGSATATGQELAYRDGLGVTDEDSIDLLFVEDTDILIIDVPMTQVDLD